MWDEALSIRPRTLVLVVVLASLATALALEVWHVAHTWRTVPVEPRPSPSVLAPGRGAPIEISGDVRGLVPGVTKAIPITFTNLGSVPVYVTRLRVEMSADSTPIGCPSGSNLTLRQATGITEKAPVLVTPGSAVRVSAYPRAPRISFRNLPVGQDACKGVTFELVYSASART